MSSLQKYFFYARAYFRPRKSARALIIRDGALLVFRRRRYDSKKDVWHEYYSIPGGGVDKGESPEQAVVRELKEEMGVDIRRGAFLAHYVSRFYEHYVYAAEIVRGEPHFMADSEEALHYVTEHNQYEVAWVPVEDLTADNLKYYGEYLDIIQRLSRGEVISQPVEIRA